MCDFIDRLCMGSNVLGLVQRYVCECAVQHWCSECDGLCAHVNGVVDGSPFHFYCSFFAAASSIVGVGDGDSFGPRDPSGSGTKCILRCGAKVDL